MRLKVFLLLALFGIYGFVSAQSKFALPAISGTTYHSPKHQSRFHHPSTQIIIRPGCVLKAQDIARLYNGFELIGESSGIHEFDATISSDGLTVTMASRSDFLWSEVVTITWHGDAEVSCLSETFFWTFRIADSWHAADLSAEIEQVLIPVEERQYPSLEVLSVNEEAIYDGNIFISTQSPTGIYLGVLSPVADPEPVWWLEVPFSTSDFKINRNGLPTYYNGTDMSWRMMNAEGMEVDAFYMTNGYQADEHDFMILPLGNYVMFAYDVQTVDMSEYVPGGNPNAQVEGFVIQEFNTNGQLIFQWRSWDFLEISDNEEVNLLSPIINPFHINAIQLDSDDNFLISCRHTNEITKINRDSGDIIWRFGLYSWNDFAFQNDLGFSYQHDVHRLENGNILLFDNANITGQVSRAVEYALDTVSWQATKVWQYAHPESLFGASRGGCQRLPNGNTIIHWGAVGVDKYGARSSEVTSTGTIALEFAYSLNVNAYRTPKHDWLFGEVIPGCPDPTAINYEATADYFDLELCQYDADGDGFSPEMGDCNDNDNSIYPNAEEIPYDNIDQDCDGTDLNDVDGDGYSGGQGGDCDDNDDTIYPGADEIPYDGIDQDCDGEDLTDVDGDGFSPADGDCNDNDDSIYSGADEIPYDGIDQDCDGEDLEDVDGDGFSPADGDCNDDDEEINPNAEEIPNDGIDQDCDGNDLIISVEEGQEFGMVRVEGGQIHYNTIHRFQKVEVLTNDGRLVWSENFSSQAGILSSSALRAGIYLVVFVTDAASHGYKVVVD